MKIKEIPYYIRAKSKHKKQYNGISYGVLHVMSLDAIKQQSYALWGCSKYPDDESKHKKLTQYI
ncbi:MAG: hypothetical protein ACFNT8_05725 [Prevotella sp.]